MAPSPRAQPPPSPTSLCFPNIPDPPDPLLALLQPLTSALPLQPHISFSDVSSCRYFKPLWYPALCSREAGGFSLICQTRASRVQARQTGTELCRTGKKEPNSSGGLGCARSSVVPWLAAAWALGWEQSLLQSRGKSFTSILGEQQLPRLGLPQEPPAKLPLACLDSDLEERFCVNHVRHLSFECLQGMLAEGSLSWG